MFHIRRNRSPQRPCPGVISLLLALQRGEFFCFKLPHHQHAGKTMPFLKRRLSAFLMQFSQLPFQPAGIHLKLLHRPAGQPGAHNQQIVVFVFKTAFQKILQHVIKHKPFQRAVRQKIKVLRNAKFNLIFWQQII